VTRCRNTFVASGGQKTRHFDDVLSEDSKFFELLSNLGTCRRTPRRTDRDNVTDVSAAGHASTKADLELNYTSIWDPRSTPTRASTCLSRREFLQRYSAGNGARSL